MAAFYLASASPRRRELLRQIGAVFEVSPAQIEERRHNGESAPAFAQRLAREKARVIWDNLPLTAQSCVLGADTVVVADEQILGKPVDRADGLRMLRLLSDRTHQVYTAVALIDGEQLHEALSVSKVTFRAITESEAQRYWDSGEPVDKAGGYAIQGYGAVFVRQLEGSFSGVVGLPLFETATLLSAAGVSLLQHSAALPQDEP